MMKPPSREFARRVYAIVARIPRGKVVTYGQIALLAGTPRSARQVGWLAHRGPSRLPWQRVVNRFGGLASGYTGGPIGHRFDLERDGVTVRDDLTVDLATYQWWPSLRQLRALAPLPPVGAQAEEKRGRQQNRRPRPRAGGAWY